MAISRNEQESIINFNEEDNNVSIYTASPRVKRLLIAKGFTQVHNLTKSNKVSGFAKNKEVAWEFECSKKDFRFGLKAIRTITEKQREELSHRMQHMVKSKGNKQG